MTSREKLYKRGFLDGMRYSGHLLDDVPDEDLELSPYLQRTIMESYFERDNLDGEVPRVEKLHAIFRDLVLDNNRQYEDIEELRRLLGEANKSLTLAGYPHVTQNYPPELV